MKTLTLKRDRALLEKRRLKAGRYFSQGKSQAFVAKHFNVSTSASCQWYWQWKEEGNEGLASKGPTGSDPKLSEENKKKLKKLILEGPKKSGYQTEFWTLSRIRDIAKKKFKVTLGTGSVWRTVISLGFSCQKPERRSKQRNEKAIQDWKLKEFPKLKKMGETQ
jgi:transposase